MMVTIYFVAMFLQVTLANYTEADGKIWAVLVAGSSGWKNYRHQADVLHAYQILRRHGVPDSNIILMIYDDLAYNTENPMTGKIINKPDGPNLYEGVAPDYTGDQVSPDNFEKVLLGENGGMDGIGSGAVLQSGPNDHVFIFFSDHGAPGHICFPDGQEMYKHDLIDILKTMHKKNMYKKLLFFLETCNSGSMYEEELPDNVNILATTSASPKEHSYACYCDDPIFQTCLGDEYVVSWTENVDFLDNLGALPKETLLEQFGQVVKRVVHSNPSIYGDLTMVKEGVTDFIGKPNNSVVTGAIQEEIRITCPNAVSNYEVAIYILDRRIASAKNVEERQSLEKERDRQIKGRETIDNVFQGILSYITNNNTDDIYMLETLYFPLKKEKLPCYKNLVQNFKTNCINLGKNNYARKHLGVFLNVCAIGYVEQSEVDVAFYNICTKEHAALLGID